jgi:DNA-binding Xre family transcriptional regulator
MVAKPSQRKLKNRLLQLIHERESKIGRRIRQHDIAEFAEVRDHTITAWIHNEVTRFDARVVERLCDYFQCDVADLLYFEETYVDIPEDPDQMDS